MPSRVTPRPRRRAVLRLVWLLTACGPGAGAGGRAAQPVAPLPGDNYALVYHAGNALARQDTRAAVDAPVIGEVGEVLVAEPSPDARRVAVAYRRRDSSRVVVIDAASGSLIRVHEGARGTTYTMAWSLDGERLGLGFRPEGGGGGVRVVDADGTVRNIGCRAANRFEAWRSPSEVVVHDGVNFYVVRTSECGTRARFSRAGKSRPTYARDGRRVAYFQDRTVRTANRPQYQTIPELWIAGHDGADAKVIADYQSRARNSTWAPNANRIAYEVVSRRWANTTHLVIYHVRADEYSYIAREMPLGVPSDFGACWSPDGRRIAHDRIYARSTGAQAYTTRQVVVREGTDEQVVFDEVVSEAAAQVRANRPAVCRWMGNRHLLVATRRGQRIVDVDDGETYEVPIDRRVLGVRVFDRSP